MLPMVLDGDGDGHRRIIRKLATLREERVRGRSKEGFNSSYMTGGGGGGRLEAISRKGL